MGMGDSSSLTRNRVIFAGKRGKIWGTVTGGKVLRTIDGEKNALAREDGEAGTQGCKGGGVGASCAGASLLVFNWGGKGSDNLWWFSTKCSRAGREWDLVLRHLRSKGELRVNGGNVTVEKKGAP